MAGPAACGCRYTIKERCRRKNTMQDLIGAPVAAQLAAAGLAGSDADGWARSEPGATTEFAADAPRFSAYWRASTRLLARLPPPARRSDREREAARTIM